MIVAADLPAAVGNTPLIRLRRASEATGCEIWGKAEFMNPGQSVKDRAALWIIRDAVARGALRPGGTIVEGTAGNTGIGLALIGAAIGYRTVIVIPDTQSQEKKDMIRLAGAELVEVPAVPYRDPDNYVRYSGRLAEKLAAHRAERRGLGQPVRQRRQPPGARRGTAPEIWEQTGGRIDGFICAVGSGGTLAGRRRRAPRPQARGARSASPIPTARRSGTITPTATLKAEGNSITEGIGQGRITANLEGLTVDMPYRIPDAEAVATVFDLLREEGLCLGASSGINVAGAIRMARDLGPGHTIVTVLCDYGTRYQSKLFNPDFLRAQGPAGPGLARGAAERHPRCLGGLSRTPRPRRRASWRCCCALGLVASPACRRRRRRRTRPTTGARGGLGRLRRPMPRRSDRRSRRPAPRSSRRCASSWSRQRSEALAAEQQQQPAVDELQQAARRRSARRRRRARPRRPEIASAARATCSSRSPTRRRRCWRRRRPTSAPTR